jgi:FMN reductase
VLLERSRQWLQERGVEVVSSRCVTSRPKTCCTPASTARRCIDLLQQVAQADGLIATPVYKASFPAR